MIHHENLKIYLRLGLKLKKREINDILEFNQSQWLKQYFEFNTHKRMEAEKNVEEDEKLWYKLMNIALYGKTI